MEQDNIQGSKRRLITLAFIEQERNAIDDLDKLFRGSLFPIEYYLPTALNVDGCSGEAGQLAHIDLKASLEKVRDTIVLPLILDNIDGRVTQYERHDACVEEADPNSLSAGVVQVTADYYSRLAGYLADKGLPSDPDAALHVSVDKKLLGEVVSEGLFNDIAEQILREYKPACQVYLMENWPDVTVYRRSGKGAKIADLYPVALYLDAVGQGAATMLDDICSAVMALREWKDADIALMQRRTWLSEFKAGRSAPYNYKRNYLMPDLL